MSLVMIIISKIIKLLLLDMENLKDKMFGLFKTLMALNLEIMEHFLYQLEKIVIVLKNMHMELFLYL